jgi:hypothetical protein
VYLKRIPFRPHYYLVSLCKCSTGLLQKDILVCINPLNAELNSICHLLVSLGVLTFMGPCIVSIFQYISNKKQRYTVYLYLETALHVSGGTSTHHQERINLYLQRLVFVTPLLLSVAINRCTRQSPADSDDTRGCRYTVTT